MGYSSNAIMAKSRALYGKKLTAQNYSDLIGCKNINELVSYLKNRTAYSQTFETANSEMSPWQVEELLKVHSLKCFEKVSRYEMSSGSEFYRYFIMKYDISQILRFLHFLIIGSPHSYLEELPPFFNKKSELDLYALASSDNFDDMLRALKGTEYASALKPFKNIYTDPLNYIKMENALFKTMQKKEKELLEKLSGKQKDEIKEIFTFQSDMDNIVKIYRLKRLADADKNTVMQYLNLELTHLTKKNINELLDAPYARDMFRAIGTSYYKKYFDETEFVSLEDCTRKILYKKLSREIRYSTNPLAVMICYFFLTENEVSNVTRIVEGIRNSMTPEAVGRMLTGAED